MRKTPQEKVFRSVFFRKRTVASITMKFAFLLVMLLIAITCFHVIVGKQNAKLVRKNTHNAFLFKFLPYHKAFIIDHFFNFRKQRIHIHQRYQHQSIKAVRLAPNLEAMVHTLSQGSGIGSER